MSHSPAGRTGVVCAQIGAREHYAVPRAFHRRGELAVLYTDAWAGPLLRAAGRGPLRALAARHHPELPADRVIGFTAAAVAQRARDLLAPPRDVPAEYLAHLRTGRAFGRRVARHLARSGVRPIAFFGYNTGCLEPMTLLSAQGVPTVVDQIDPARTEEDIVRREAERWPGWAARPGRIPDEYYARLEAEWAAATTVVVNSEWSRDALIAQGVPAGKLVVLPLAYDVSPGPVPDRPPPAGELTVLWLGQVLLRKGIQYLIEASRRLREVNVRVVVAGPLGIDLRAAAAPPNVEFVGPVPRARVDELYRTADVFVLPTLSDGFALTQLEAMAHGLPVVVTPNCARVVTDGIDGVVIPAGDADALASALAALAADPGRARAMGRRAAETVRAYSVNRLADRLATLPTAPAPNHTDRTADRCR